MPGPNLLSRTLRHLWHRALPPSQDRLYEMWTREHEPSKKTLRAQREWSRGRTRTISLISLADEGDGWMDLRTAASVHAQSYQGWEWIVVAPEGRIEEVSRTLGSGNDPRVRTLAVPSGVSRADAWNSALREARGEFAALLDSGDVLAPAALYEMAQAIDQPPDSDVLYSDEDRMAPRGTRRHDPHFKPDWSPELLLSSNYIGRLTLLRRNAAIAAGGFRHVEGGAEEWELLLRLSRSPGRIRRVPRCLYHRVDSRLGETDAGAKAVVEDHCRALGLRPMVTKSAGALRVSWDVPQQPIVSIVIPNRNAAAVFKQCVAGLLEKTAYDRRELIVVDNGSTEPEVLELYRSLERRGAARIVPFDRPFNFSAACNAGAAAASGDLLLFLNNDTEVIQPDWLDELVRWAQRPDVGIVGAKLLYPNRTIQHGGVVFGIGLVGHIFAGAAEGTSGVFGSSESYRNYLAVTGACQMMRTDVFRKLGGFDERFRLSFSDVVLCMETWKAGYRVVYTPFARLIHHESYTRQREDSAEDMDLLARYLRTTGFAEDPFFHPDLNAQSPIPAVRPPFDRPPRQVISDFVERVLAAADSARRWSHAFL